ncbi:amidohydrolase family protein [Candidatus Woesearchaeota archaeon]|nr:amidohydrolase family protein [Candidatus Woesearchaeota archaeon]
MIIDIHTHVGENHFVAATLEQLEKEMKKNKVDFSACFALGGTGVKEKSLSLAKECKAGILPFFRFDPKEITEAELERYLPLFFGVKLHPRWENFDPLDEAFASLFRIIEKCRSPVLIHTRKENNANTDPDRLVALVEKNKRINFIFGHFANAVDSVIRKTKELPNLFLETSIVSSPKIVEMAVQKCGSEKILFGSDFPYSDQELEVEKIRRANLRLPEKENIFYKNALRLLGREKIYKLRKYS